MPQFEFKGKKWNITHNEYADNLQLEMYEKSTIIIVKEK